MAFTEVALAPLWHLIGGFENVALTTLRDFAYALRTAASTIAWYCV